MYSSAILAAARAMGARVWGAILIIALAARADFKPCPGCISSERVANFPLQLDFLAARSPTGPRCLDGRMTWEGRPNTDGRAFGVVDKIYVVHYSRVKCLGSPTKRVVALGMNHEM